MEACSYALFVRHLAQTSVPPCWPYFLPTPCRAVYHSASPHKEFRFLMPVLPVAHAYAGQAVWSYLQGRDKRDGVENRRAGTPQRSPERHEEGSGEKPQAGANLASAKQAVSWPRGRRRLAIAAAIICLHAPAALYLSVWHQRGTLAAVDIVAGIMPGLAKAAKLEAREVKGEQGTGNGPVRVHFLMPCHAAPLHSHLHFRRIDVDLWSLDCSPE